MRNAIHTKDKSVRSEADTEEFLRLNTAIKDIREFTVRPRESDKGFSRHQYEWNVWLAKMRSANKIGAYSNIQRIANRFAAKGSIYWLRFDVCDAPIDFPGPQDLAGKDPKSLEKQLRTDGLPQKGRCGAAFHHLCLRALTGNGDKPVRTFCWGPDNKINGMLFNAAKCKEEVKQQCNEVRSGAFNDALDERLDRLFEDLFVQPKSAD